MRQHSDSRCFECKAELPKKLIYSHKREEAREAEPEGSLKRVHADEPAKISIKTEETKTQAKDPFTSIKDAGLSAKLADVIAALKKKSEFTLGTEVSQETQQL